MTLAEIKRHFGMKSITFSRVVIDKENTEYHTSAVIDNKYFLMHDDTRFAKDLKTTEDLMFNAHTEPTDAGNYQITIFKAVLVEPITL